MGSNKLIKGKNDLLSQNSELASEWNYQRNGELKPEDVAYQSNKLVWWKCKICGYEWKSTVNNRNRGNGCPCCLSQVVVTEVNDLQTLNKDLSMEWNYEKNGLLTPEMFSCGSNEKVWWKCSKGHE